MRNILHTIFAILCLVSLPCCSTPQPLILCGWDEVFIIDVTQAQRGSPAKFWSWRAKDRPELPVAMHKAFRTTDDCKPVDGGRQILISSSSGGCALIEYPAGNVVWHAAVPNAHSIEMLPGNRILAAASVSAKGNRLMLFDAAKSDHLLWETPLHSAHGVVWDSKRKLVWALGFDELRCYTLTDWNTAMPSLSLTQSHKLPDVGGHDLQLRAADGRLTISTHDHVFLFDIETKSFSPHPQLGDLPNVKCVSTHPHTGRVAHLRGEGKNWWTTRLGLLHPEAEIHLPGEHLYKARWFVNE